MPATVGGFRRHGLRDYAWGAFLIALGLAAVGFVFFQLFTFFSFWQERAGHYRVCHTKLTRHCSDAQTTLDVGEQNACHACEKVVAWWPALLALFDTTNEWRACNQLGCGWLGDQLSSRLPLLVFGMGMLFSVFIFMTCQNGIESILAVKRDRFTLPGAHAKSF